MRGSFPSAEMQSVYSIAPADWASSCRRAVEVQFNQQVGNTGVHTFSKGIYPKVNVIARVEIELTYNDIAVE